MAAQHEDSLMVAHDGSQRYHVVSVVLHWVIALGILGNAGLGLALAGISDDHIRAAIDLHKSIGITVLVLVAARVAWRLHHRPPAPSLHYAAWQIAVKKLAHALLYFLMLAIPISGWMHDSAWKDADSYPLRLFGVVPWPRIGVIAELGPELKEHLHGTFAQWHHWTVNAMYAVLSLHVAATIRNLAMSGANGARGMLAVNWSWRGRR